MKKQGSRRAVHGLVFAALLALSLVASAGDAVARTDSGDASALAARGGGGKCPLGATWEKVGGCTLGISWE